MGFLGVHRFHEMRETLWLSFRASILHEKLNLSQESQHQTSLISGFWIFFLVFRVDGMVCRCFELK